MTLNIDVYSDVVCPWCYIGLRRLSKALDATALRGTARVRWLPFELNPGLPAGGTDRRAYMENKFGAEESLLMEQRIAMIGKFENVDFRFDRIARQPNTFNAHRLIRWADLRGRQQEVAEGLFRAHFTEGRDIGSLSVLAEVAAEQGLPKDEARAFLESDELSSEIKTEEAQATRKGIGFVPFFVVNAALTIRGAEDPDVIAGVLREAAGPVSTQNTA